jgi:hypothetical protein
MVRKFSDKTYHLFMWAFLVLLTLTLFLQRASAEEGMWTLNNFPKKSVEKKYHFNASDEWLKHVQLSSARLAGGCSGSFVSANGLVMTNHHCAAKCIEQISNSKKDYVEAGFYAKTAADEVKCPEIEVNKLVGITDVTSKIQNATQNLNEKDYNEKLKAQIAEIEKACSAGSEKIRCDVVTLYHGGAYNLYKYERYQDVRLVFAPEFATAFFGGDPDNFMFPRYDLDVSFLRVYEQQRPLRTEDFFKWSKSGAQTSELTFVTGHPGSTARLLTVSDLEFARDEKIPKNLILMSELRGLLTEFQRRGPEQKRISKGRLFSIENYLKAMKGRFLTLNDKKFFATKIAQEKNLIQKINTRAKLKKEYGTAFQQNAEANLKLKNIATELEFLETNSYGSKLFSIARSLVRAADELPKPNDKRFHEFTDSSLPQLKQGLFSAAPIYDELEISMMTFWLTKMRENLTADHPFVKKILGQKSPEELANEIVKSSKLKDIQMRHTLFDGGKAKVDASTDSMIAFAKLIDPDARSIRKIYEDDIESVLKKNAEKIAKAQFAVYGSQTYPDATFTLRISYGQVKGYEEKGHLVLPQTTFAGAFSRNTGKEPFALPESWLKAKDKINLNAHLDFCSTNDIIGGNSGSPVINQKAEVVGIIFDGNIQSLGGDYGYDESVNRAVAVDSAGILESLDKIYGASRLTSELK